MFSRMSRRRFSKKKRKKQLRKKSGRSRKRISRRTKSSRKRMQQSSKKLRRMRGGWVPLMEAFQATYDDREDIWEVAKTSTKITEEIKPLLGETHLEDVTNADTFVEAFNNLEPVDQDILIHYVKVTIKVLWEEIDKANLPNTKSYIDDQTGLFKGSPSAYGGLHRDIDKQPNPVVKRKVTIFGQLQKLFEDHRMAKRQRDRENFRASVHSKVLATSVADAEAQAVGASVHPSQVSNNQGSDGSIPDYRQEQIDKALTEQLEEIKGLPAGKERNKRLKDLSIKRTKQSEIKLIIEAM